MSAVLEDLEVQARAIEDLPRPTSRRRALRRRPRQIASEELTYEYLDATLRKHERLQDTPVAALAQTLRDWMVAG